jgi:hypothetical protein
MGVFREGIMFKVCDLMFKENLGVSGLIKGCFRI